MFRLQPFRQRQKLPQMLNQLNDMVNRINQISNILGDNLINIKQTAAGTTVGLNINVLKGRLAKVGLSHFHTKIFEVQSAATGDGVYNCYEQTLDATEWDDTAGDDKFDDKDAVSVEVLNLLENNPADAYSQGLQAGDRMHCWKWIDDETNSRWVGVPISGGLTRRARVQSIEGNYVTVKLLTTNGGEVGDAFNVFAVEHLGTNAFDGDVWPSLSVDDKISIFQDLDGHWYTTFLFDDSFSDHSTLDNLDYASAGHTGFQPAGDYYVGADHSALDNLDYANAGHTGFEPTWAEGTPASSGAAGVKGTKLWDANFIYICTATNTWERVAIAEW